MSYASERTTRDGRPVSDTQCRYCEHFYETVPTRRRHEVSCTGDVGKPPIYGRAPAMDILPEVIRLNEEAIANLEASRDAARQFAREERDGTGTAPKDRKAVPIATGVLAYFPLAIKAVARLSQIGNDQHNPGKPLHWDRSKSGDEADALMRHMTDYLIDPGGRDTDGVRHSTKVAWRALAMLQKEIEADNAE